MRHEDGRTFRRRGSLASAVLSAVVVLLAGCDDGTAQPRPSASNRLVQRGREYVRDVVWRDGQDVPEDEPSPEDPEECAQEMRMRSSVERLVADYAEAYDAHEPPPPGPPLAKNHFEGVFPPVWHVGDSWRVVHLSLIPVNERCTKEGYRYQVLREPKDPDGEYEIEIQPFFLPEELRQLEKDQVDIEMERVERRRNRHVVATFWARDFSLISLLEEPLGRTNWYRRTGSGPHPHEAGGFGGASAGKVFADLVGAFPSWPPRLVNPLVWEFHSVDLHSPRPGETTRLAIGHKRTGWQIVHPTDEGLDFVLMSTNRDVTRCRTWNGRGQRLVWKHGDPWWSVMIDLDEPYPLPVEGEERIEGHRVLARLLRPGDPEWPEDEPAARDAIDDSALRKPRTTR